MLKIKGFLPFLMVVFANAFVDLGHKIVIQNTLFKVYDGDTQIILTAVVNALIVLPALLLFSPAGFIADRFHKPVVMRISALIAVGLSLLITLTYYLGWFEAAFAMTFVLAMQSAFYAPAKYGFIRAMAGKSRLSAANGAVQAVTIIAILLGVFVFTVLFETLLSGVVWTHSDDILQQVAPLGWLLVAFSVFEWRLTLHIPLYDDSNVKSRFSFPDYAKGRYLKNNLRAIAENKKVYLPIIGLALFWGIAQVTLAAFPAFAKEVLDEDNTIVIQGLLALSGIGIAIGSLLAARYSRLSIETGLIPLAAIGIVATLFMLPSLTDVYLIGGNFLLLGLFGGLFIVPLNALIQLHTKNSEQGVVMAGNNWVQNLAMIAFLALAIAFSLHGIGGDELFYLLASIAVVGAAYAIIRLPREMLRFLIARLFSTRYRMVIEGFNRVPEEGAVLLLGNHISWLDWAIVQIASPRPVRFVMERAIYQRWYLKGLLDAFGVVPISSGDSRKSLENINQLLRQGEVVCLFPEGAISRNGQLGEFKRGFERVVDGVKGSIVPFYIQGLWGSRFSRSRTHRAPLNTMRRQITLVFGKALAIESNAVAVKQAVTLASVEAWKLAGESYDPIAQSWVKRVKQQGAKVCLVDAMTGTSLSGRKALIGALSLAATIKKNDYGQKRIALLLPTSSAGVIANMAGLISGKTLVNLNYTASLSALQSALQEADVKTIYSSRRFVKKLAAKGIDMAALLKSVNVVYLEDVFAKMSTVTKSLRWLAVWALPAFFINALFVERKPLGAEAAILFSSGSEGKPKGVVLSQSNLMSNMAQVSDVLDADENDKFMATLPLFHAFGLTVTSLLPLVEGIPVVCHPDPTDVTVIGKAIATHEATIFCATSTFLRLFTRNRRVHPLMLQSLRLVIAGAERLSPDVRQAVTDKFKLPIYEGYGATETAPVASVNIPDRLDKNYWRPQLGSKAGTVGLPLPGTGFRVVDPVTMNTLKTGEDGLILIAGSQLMQGYLNNIEKTAEVLTELDGFIWYKTGDKGHIDDEGFLTIVDRYSRFAKLGGEMISLSAVEQAVSHLLPSDTEVLATNVSDSKKGEKIILLVAGDLSLDDVRQQVMQSSINPLMKPASYIHVSELPKLGSGKSDYAAAKQMALASD